MRPLIKICLVWVCLLLSANGAWAVVREGRIEEVPGLRFENVRYGWGSLWVNIVNMTDRNVQFGGAMIFLDRNGNVLAVAQLLPKRAVRNSVGRYNAHFQVGSGDGARRAVRVLWDIGPR